ncbi:REJ domain-containing protein [Chitinophaga dinghuensis]|uniref:REJ domain-containing protein n=1 Tax=Chitinophaga dinghuensis TaxID=1539050 RepID=A0A327VYB2_9BACT|nr:PKD domain-containing protein [Chitinophaga dinghuensis]RAJ79935.1 REJ domain-containing protein [Chitinophaga dinghuensis]
MNDLNYFNKRLKIVIAVGMWCWMIFATPTAVAQQGKLTAKVTGLFNPAGLLESLPQDYATSNKKYPLLLFFHGLGEEGDGINDIWRVIANGPPKLINQGTFPATFTVNGNTYSFIVICPQMKGPPPNIRDLDSIINYCFKNYRVDTNRVYFTGLSRGGGEIWGYCSAANYCANRTAAMVPICGAYDPGPLRTPMPYAPITLAANNVPIWALHNSGDPTVPVSSSQNWQDLVNAYTPKCNPQMKLTIFNANGHDAWSKAYDPNYRENGMNVYEWMLQYSTINRNGPVTNKPPVANAGSNITITLPATAQLDGSASSDPDGTITTYKWTQVSGPNTAGISSPGSAKTALTNLVKGVYTFQLTVTDNGGLTATANVQVTVQDAAVNKPPVANAGSNFTITLPATAQLDGSASSDPDGTITTYKWTQVSGPNTAGISSPGSAKTALTNLVKGVYSFQLTVTDNGGLTATANVQVTVQDAPVNKPPVANVGADQIITLPVNAATLDGSASSDPDGTIATWKWTQVSGPNTAAFSAATAAKTTASGLIKGVYAFRLTVTDNGGLSASANIQVTVQDAPIDKKPPVAVINAPDTILLPVNKVKLNASASTDPDGTIVSWAWSQLSGPGIFLENGGTAVATAINMPPGVYNFKLLITDNDGLSATATKKVVVVDPNDHMPNDGIAVKYYPNPTRGNLRLEVRKSDVHNLRVTIYDIRGLAESRYTYTVNGNTYIDLDLSSLANGIHMVELRGEGNFRWTGRVMKF